MFFLILPLFQSSSKILKRLVVANVEQLYQCSGGRPARPERQQRGLAVPPAGPGGRVAARRAGRGRRRGRLVEHAQCTRAGATGHPRPRAGHLVPDQDIC